MRIGAAMDSANSKAMEINNITAIDSVSIEAIDAGLEPTLNIQAHHRLNILKV
jgi:hypothetical protein